MFLKRILLAVSACPIVIARPTFIASSACLLLMACGSRTGIPATDEVADEPVMPCDTALDCAGEDLCRSFECVEGACQLVDEVQCTPRNSCFEAACNPATGRCDQSRLTQDLDGDGHYAPLPGTLPGAPDSCGDDCDDTRREAFPGGVERCDGVDNDCDGVVDNGSRYLGDIEEDVPLTFVPTGDLEASGRRGIAYGNGVFAVGYWGRADSMLSYLRGFRADGSEAFSQTPVTSVNAPSFGADLVFDGASFGATWSDTRTDGNYEVYFARFDAAGEKLGPDLRVTDAPDFSIHTQVIYDQGRFVLVFDDRRDEDVAGGSQIFAQIVDSNGQLVGGNQALSPLGDTSEYPQLAATPRRYGLTYTGLGPEGVGVYFRSFDKNFQDATPPVALVAEDGRAPNITAVGDDFLVTWDIYFSDGPGGNIGGTVVDERGEAIVPNSFITFGAEHARSHATYSLGDRVLLVWADDLEGNYELYAKVLSLELTDLESRQKLTNDPADTLAPRVALGDDGRIGVVFDDWRSGTHGTYFTTLGCDADPQACADCSGCLTDGPCPACCQVF